MAEFSYGNSWTDLCNKALGRLGATRIMNLEDGQNASYCRLHLGETIEKVYGEADYNAAKKTVELARLAETPVKEYSYKYQLPVDSIRLVDIDAAGERYAIEGTAVLTDADQVYLTYIARPTDPAAIPGYLKKRIILELAFVLTTEIVTGTEIVQKIAAEIKESVSDALAADARGNYDENGNGSDYYDEGR